VGVIGHVKAFGRWPVALLLVMGGLALAATPFSAPSRPAAATPDENLDEITVDGLKVKAVRDPQKVIGWLARLVGEFTYEGEVDVRGKGDPADLLEVEGTADCRRAGRAVAVQCELRVRWPGGVSNLDPAVMLFGFEQERIGIRYMLVDSNGIAAPALGLLFGDTLVSRTPCVGVAGNCEKAARITAAPDRVAIHMQVETQVDLQNVATFSFVMNRVAGSELLSVEGAE
jgi:hypothetical protein